MKFFTRQLFDAMQGDPDDPEAPALEAQWQKACDAYRTQLDVIRAKLPPGMQSLADTTFHDSVVLAVEQPRESELAIEIDSTGNPWGPTGRFSLLFTGVREVEGLATLVGDDWVYEEIHLHPLGAFEYRVMFTDTDFRVVADELEVRPLL